MRLQRLTNYLLSHRIIAMAATFIVTFIPVLGVFGILFATLVTLRKGLVEGAMFTIAATLPYFLSYYVTGYVTGGHEEIPMFAWVAIGVAVTSNVLTWIFAVMLTKRVTWSAALQMAALFGVLVISVIHLAYPTVQDWWGVQLNSYYMQAADALNATATSVEEQQKAINVTKEYATGLVVAAILLNAFTQLVAAAWWRAIVFIPGSLRRELHNIRLSRLAGGLFVTSLLLSYLGNSVVLDIMPILYLLFTAAGLSLIHYLFGLMKTPVVWFWLSLLYVTLIFAMPVSFVAVAILALMDIWFDVRKKVKKG